MQGVGVGAKRPGSKKGLIIQQELMNLEPEADSNFEHLATITK